MTTNIKLQWTLHVGGTGNAPEFYVRGYAGTLICFTNDEETARIVAAAPDLLDAVKICLDAERERKKKLLPGAPATTYTQTRIDYIERVLEKIGVQ